MHVIHSGRYGGHAHENAHARTYMCAFVSCVFRMSGVLASHMALDLIIFAYDVDLLLKLLKERLCEIGEIEVYAAIFGRILHVRTRLCC